MDDVKVCKRCRKLFTHYSSEYCNECSDEMEEIFVTIREYIYDHPNHNLVEIAKETGTKESDIMYLLRQGRISFSSVEGSCLSCDNCGTPIVSGRLCEPCKQGLGKAMGDMLERDARSKPPPEKNVKYSRQGVTHLDDVIKR